MGMVGGSYSGTIEMMVASGYATDIQDNKEWKREEEILVWCRDDGKGSSIWENRKQGSEGKSMGLKRMEVATEDI